MRILFIILGGVLLLCTVAFLVSPPGRLLLAFAVEDISRDPLIKRIETEARKQSSQWGVQTSNSLSIFENHRDRKRIEKLLESAGFKKIEKLPELAFSLIKGDFEFGTDIYEGHNGGLPCNETVFVFLWFDEAEMLTRVKSMQLEEGCL